MNFIDDASAERIGLTRIRQRLQPLSPYGRLLKSRMPVFLPGCEELVGRNGRWCTASWRCPGARCR